VGTSRVVGLVLGGALLLARPIAAQQDSAVAAQHDTAFLPVDRIAAIVGTTPIPLSRVDEELNFRLAEIQRSGQSIPTDSATIAQLRLGILNQLIDEELLVRQALHDTTVKVTDAQVQSATDAALRETRSQFSSDLEYRRQLQLAGFGTPEEYRQMLTEQTRRRLLAQTLIQRLREKGDIRQIPPTEQEVRDYYQATKAQQPKRPASVTFRQIVIRTLPTAEAKQVALAKADSVLRELRAGADFAAAARRFSADSGTRAEGGELGWFRRGHMVREFESVAFRLRPGQVSNVVETPYGYHIIQVERIEPGEVKARHILFAPTITDADRAAARARADSVAAALRGGAALDSLSRLYHDPLEQSLFEAVPLTQLPPPLRSALATAEAGEIVGPVEETDGGRTRYAVVRFDERLPEGEYSFEDLRDQIRATLAENSGVRRYLADLRSQTYIDIRL
jgi:peptidyl-prolyl cis-trans isomerase SurA